MTWEKTDQCEMNEGVKRFTEEKKEKAINFFRSKGISVSHSKQGLEVGGKYIFSPKSFKWRKIGKGKWYRSGGHKHFYNIVYC